MLVLILDWKLVSDGSCSPFIDFLELSFSVAKRINFLGKMEKRK